MLTVAAPERRGAPGPKETDIAFLLAQLGAYAAGHGLRPGIHPGYRHLPEPDGTGTGLGTGTGTSPGPGTGTGTGPG